MQPLSPARQLCHSHAAFFWWLQAPSKLCIISVANVLEVSFCRWPDQGASVSLNHKILTWGRSWRGWGLSPIGNCGGTRRNFDICKIKRFWALNYPHERSGSKKKDQILSRVVPDIFSRGGGSTCLIRMAVNMECSFPANSAFINAPQWVWCALISMWSFSNGICWGGGVLMELLCSKFGPPPLQQWDPLFIFQRKWNFQLKSKMKMKMKMKTKNDLFQPPWKMKSKRKSCKTFEK